MRLTVPSVKGVDAKTPKGVIGQLLHDSETVQGELTRFVLPSGNADLSGLTAMRGRRGNGTIAA